MAEGYEDIDRLVAQKRQGLDTQLQQMNELTDKDVQLQTERLARQKEDIDRETVQQNRAIYQDYKKNSNPFGVQAENLASQGLGNSGYAETTQSRLYNTYQNNITSTLNTARQLKSDVDFAINEAIKTGDITKGQNAMRIFEQSLQLLSEEYDLKNNREQVLYQRAYQKERDKIEDNWRNTEWNYKVKQDKNEEKWKKKQWDYQVKQDKNEEKWRQKEWNYNTSKKSSASSSRRSSGSTSGNRTYKNKPKKDDQSINPEDNIKKSDNAETALKALGNSKLAKLLKTGAKELARPIIMGGVLKYQQTKGKEGISEKQAEALFEKYGL